MMLDPSIFVFLCLFQRKKISMTFKTNKASKSVKNENHNFRLLPKTDLYFEDLKTYSAKNGLDRKIDQPDLN